MSKYETYSEEKWLERHGIREDSFYLRETYGRVEDKQRWKYRSGKSARGLAIENIVEFWQIILGIIMLIIVLAKMHASIEVLQEKVKVLFELFNRRNGKGE